MNETQRGMLTGVAWSELCPWLLLFRAFRVASSPLLILVAATGALLAPAGWQAASWMFRPEPPAETSEDTGPAGEPQRPLTRLAGDAARWPWELYDRYGDASSPEVRSAAGFLPIVPGSLVSPWHRWFFAPVPLRESVFLLAGNIWTLLVWGLCGGMITRIAVVRIGRDERLGVRETLHFVRGRAISYCTAPLFPQIAFLLAIMMGTAAGSVMRWDAGAVLVALAWPLLLILALLCTIVFLGLALGWPLMWVTISAERDGDVFEATQRAFSYSWDRPFHYGFYVLVAAVYGMLCWLLVTWFARGVLHFADWSVSWGAGWERLQEIMQAEEGAMHAARRVIVWSRGFVMCLVIGFAYSFFWTAFSAIYLLLRRAVDDHVPFDRVYVPDDRERYPLPPIAVDEEGVVSVAEEEPSTPSEPAAPSAPNEEFPDDEPT